MQSINGKSFSLAASRGGFDIISNVIQNIAEWLRKDVSPCSFYRSFPPHHSVPSADLALVAGLLGIPPPLQGKDSATPPALSTLDPLSLFSLCQEPTGRAAGEGRSTDWLGGRGTWILKLPPSRYFVASQPAATIICREFCLWLVAGARLADRVRASRYCLAVLGE